MSGLAEEFIPLLFTFMLCDTCISVVSPSVFGIQNITGFLLASTSSMLNSYVHDDNIISSDAIYNFIRF